MPVDARHGRFIPTGREIARVLSNVFRRQKLEVYTAIRAGQGINLARWDETLAELVRPQIVVETARGGNDAAKRIRQLSRSAKSLRGERRKAPVLSAAAADNFVRLDVLEFDVFRPEVQTAIRTAAMAFAASTNATSTVRLSLALQLLRRELEQGLAQGEALQRLTQRVGDIFANPARAFMIAATEASRAMHAGQFLAARASEIVKGKRWQASSDACPACMELDGQEVDLESPFHVDPKGGAYAVTMYPPLHPHCMCTWIEVL